MPPPRTLHRQRRRGSAGVGNAAVLLYNKVVSVRYLRLHNTHARCAHRLEIAYFPASFSCRLVVWRTFLYGNVAQHTSRCFQVSDRVQPRGVEGALCRRQGLLPLVRLHRAIAPKHPHDDVLLARLLVAQTRSVVGCSYHCREYVFACMMVLSRLAPQLPTSLWRDSIWAFL